MRTEEVRDGRRKYMFQKEHIQTCPQHKAYEEK